MQCHNPPLKYLITGGAGFIGSHLSEELISRGHEVVVLDDFSTGTMENLKAISQHSNFNLINGNIKDSEVVARLVRESDGVFHLAAAVGVQKILIDPIGSLETNIKGSENVLFSATKFNKRVMVASTSEIYGKNSEVPLTEISDRVLGSPLLSRWTYSEAKAIDEAISYTLFKREGLKVQIVRFFNTVGPRQSSSYGMVIPTFMSSAINNRNLKVNGTGMQQRVFCHVYDAIQGVLALWDSGAGYGEAFNLGGFEETSILDLAKRIITLVGSTSKIELIPYSQLTEFGFEDMLRRVPDTSKLQLATGWKAKIGLEQILRDVRKSFV